MALQFARKKPLQALKVSSVAALLLFGIAGFVGLLPGRGLDALLLLAFFPMLLAVVVAGEALLAAYRLARADEPTARLTARPAYTAVRAIEVVVTVGAPGTFYILIVEIGGEVAGPGAIGLLFYGIALGSLALGAVLLRTLAEYHYHRRDRASADSLERGENVAE
jgi:hypothetical protein